MKKWGVFVTWHELTGERPSNELLRSRLSAYALQPVLLGLARISAQLVTWQKRQNADGELEAVRQILPKYYPAIKQLCAATGDRIVLSRITILYVAKQALMACPLVGRDIDTPWDDEQVMSCCLMANDLLLGRTPSPADTIIDKAASLLPFNNYLPDPDDPFEIPRNLLLINDIAPQLAGIRSDYRDLAQEFHAATKLSPQEFCESAYCVAAKFITDLAAQNNPAGLVLTADYFRHTKIPEALAEFVGHYTIALDALQQKLRKKPSLDDDFLIFQDHPLIEFLPGHHMCIDPGFLLDKAGKSFYWTLHAGTSPRKQQDHLLGYWAAVVEKYLQWLTERTYLGGGTLASNPYFPNGDEACDLMIKEGSRLVLIEIKASVLTAKAKYGFDANLLQEELLLKAIHGEDRKRKGIAQLSHNIQRFYDGEPINGIKCDQISTIYPMIVFLDKSFTSPYLGPLYKQHFDRARFKRRPLTTPPYAITVSDFESILTRTYKHTLTDIVEDHHRHNRTNDGTVAFGRFAYSKVPLLKGTPAGIDIVRERFSQFHDDLIANVFPPTASSTSGATTP